jgi:hypothetical protein
MGLIEIESSLLQNQSISHHKLYMNILIIIYYLITLMDVSNTYAL